MELEGRVSFPQILLNFRVTLETQQGFYRQFMLLTVLRRWSWCCSYTVWRCGLHYGTLHVLKSSSALCTRVSSFFSALCSPRLGKRELHAYRAFVCLFCMCSFLSFSLPFGVGVGCGLWLWHCLDFSVNFCEYIITELHSKVSEWRD